MVVMRFPYLTVSEAAAKLNVTPRAISDAIYSRRVDGTEYPIVGGRRMIPVEKLPELRALLKRKDKD